MTTDTTSAYNPIPSEADLYAMFPILNASVEDVSYVLIIIVTMIVVIGYYSLNLNDLSGQSYSLTYASNSTTGVGTGLSALTSSVTYSDDANGGDGGYVIDTTIFSEADAEQLADSFTQLYFSDSNTGLTWDQMYITDPTTGTSYYLQPNGSWSTTAFTGEDQVVINGQTITPADYGLTGSSYVSDLGLYIFSQAAYTVDIAVFNGNPVDIETTFPTESEFTSGDDPILNAAYALWGDFTAPTNPDGQNSTSLLYGTAMYESGQGTSQLKSACEWLAYGYGESLQDGGGSLLSTMTQDANTLLTQINNMSTLLTNQIQTYVQWVSTMYSLAKVIIQNATSANMNSVNNQKV